MWRNARYGLRGVRVGEASLEPTAADSRPTQSTIPAVSGEVRDVLRRRTHSSGGTTMVNSSEPLQGHRFAFLGEHHGEADEDRPRRRLVLVSQQAHHGVDHDGESDTESLGGASDVEDVGEVLEPTVVETPVPMEVRVRPLPELSQALMQ